ncbi:Retinal guanylyl cyclase 1 [Mactra antiquata]
MRSLYLGIVLCIMATCRTGSGSKKTLQIVWMIPFKTHPGMIFPHNASTSVGALALGIRNIQDDQILPDYELNVTLLDTNCSSKQDIGRLVDLVCDNRVDVVIGPPCAEVVRPVAELLAYKNLPYINWISIGQSIRPAKNGTETCIRLMAPISSLGGIMGTSYITKTKWARFVLISSNGADYKEGATSIEASLKSTNKKDLKIYYPYTNVRINASDTEIQDMFNSITREGRIIIMLIPRDELRHFMLVAKKLNMTNGNFQFLFTDTKPVVNRNGIIVDSDALWKQNDKHDADAKQAFESVLYFALGHDTPLSNWQKEADQAFDHVFRPDRPDIDEPKGYDEYAAYLHDAVYLYALILNITLSRNETPSGLNLFKHLTDDRARFRGLSGDVVINLRGDRQPSFYVFDLDSTTGVFQQVAMFRFLINENHTLSSTSSYSNITWGNGFRTDNFSLFPSDIPECGFLGEKCPEDDSPEQNNTLVISVSVSASSVIVLLFIALVYRYWRNEKNLQSLSWKLNYSELDFNFAKSLITRSTVQRKNSTTLFHQEHNKNGSVTSYRRDSSVPEMSPKKRRRRQSSSPDDAPRFFRHRNSSPDLSFREFHSTTDIALYKEELVSVKTWPRKKISMDRSFLLQVKNLRELQHINLTKFIGVCTTQDKICSVREYCAKGSIQDLIQNKEIKLDIMFKMSLAVDICQGLDYLHKSSIKHHGNLRSTNCVIDSRWVCKLTDFGIQTFRSMQESEELLGEQTYYSRLFWTAPEVLRRLLRKESYELTHQIDIYAYGIIIKELICRTEPYSSEHVLTPKEIIIKVSNPPTPEFIFRPDITATELGTDLHSNMKNLIKRCWAEDPDSRPSTKWILRTLNKINPYKKASVVDNVLAMMEKYTNDLEDIVAERTSQVQEEKKKTDALLYSILPRKVADELKAGRTVEAEAFDAVTIYFSDIVEFTRLCSESTPLEIVEFLNPLYTMFDDIISNYNVYKVETIGDSYMVASGLPERNGNLAVKEIAEMSLDILQSVLTFSIPHRRHKQLKIRIGLHTGPVVAGVVGLTMPRYCLFGDTVNTASRMESTGEPLKIHISPYTKTALDRYPGFIVEERGEITVKGKGIMHTFWLKGIKYTPSARERSPRYSRVYERLSSPNIDPTGEIEHALNNANKEHIKVNESGSERKISVADSGISLEHPVVTNPNVRGVDLAMDKNNDTQYEHIDKIYGLTKLKHVGHFNNGYTTDLLLCGHSKPVKAMPDKTLTGTVIHKDFRNVTDHVTHNMNIPLLDNISERGEFVISDEELDRKDPSEIFNQILPDVTSETTKL